MEEAITIPGYQIKREIGRGGMASVYCAVQESLNRDVALKIMSSTLVSDDSFKQRFVNEGRIIAQLLHPNIVTIFDIGVYQQYYYLAMELLAGDTLKQRIQQGLTPSQAVAIAKALAKALGHAHQRGFIHRDIKPANVLFRDDDTLVLTDFGIAKTLNAVTQMTAAGYTLGSTGYMSPEQALGKPLDSRSDLYSVGILFWEMLNKTMPYEGEDAFAVALKHATEPVPKLPAALVMYQPIIDGLMAKNPGDRFASAEELIAALDVFDMPSNSGSRQTLMLDTAANSDGTQTLVMDQTSGPKKAAVPKTSTTKTHMLSWIGGGIGLLLAAAGVFWVTNQRPQPALTTQTNTTPAVESVPVEAPVRTESSGAEQQASVKVEQNDPQPLADRAKPAASEPVTAIETVQESEPPQEPSVQQLLIQAKQQLRARQFFEPAGSNALETYQRVRKLEPLNQEARDGMIAIGRIRLGIQHEQAAQQLLDTNELAAALEKINAGLRLAPDYEGLIELRKHVQSQLNGDQ